MAETDKQKNQVMNAACLLEICGSDNGTRKGNHGLHNNVVTLGYTDHSLFYVWSEYFLLWQIYTEAQGTCPSSLVSSTFS